MDLFNGRDKINSFFILFVILLISVIFCAKPGWALDPTVTDVATRSFSVVWTEDNTITDLGQYSLNIKNTNNELLKEYTTSGSVIGDANQIDISMESDADALARRVYKFEVIGLDSDTTYRCQGTKSNGSSALFSGDYEEVTTEKFRGLAPEADANDHDIVTNDIVHLAIYDSDGETPALGALLMGEIYSDAECTANKLSDYPLTGWTGGGMPGITNETNYQAKMFNPNNVSYKEFAALNWNNLFDLSHYPLQLTGNEYAKVTIVPGNTPVAGDLIQKIPIPNISTVETSSGDQKISTAKVTQKITLQVGMNIFSYPFEVPSGYTYQDLANDIYAAGGKIKFIKRYNAGDGSWPPADCYGDPPNPPYLDPWGVGDTLIEQGTAYLVFMDSIVPQNFYIGNSPTPNNLTLNQGLNLINFSQVPTFYRLQDLANAISAAGGKAKFIKRYNTGDGSWPPADVYGDPPNPPYLDPWGVGDTLIKRGDGYLIMMEYPTSVSVDPLSY